MAIRIVGIGLFIFSCISASSQSVGEAVRYSMLNYTNSARSGGAGNAFSALGAELSTASTNPAGIAEFRKSEFVFSLDYLNRDTESRFFTSNPTTNTKTLFSINQIAAVFVRRPLSSSWQTFNFAIGMNTTGVYHQDFSWSGNSQGSIVERFTELADGLAPSQLDNFEAGLAYDVQLLYDFEDDDIYESDFTDFSSTDDKAQTVNRVGSQREVFLSVAANKDNKLSIGATIGFPIVRFEETKVYTETDQSDLIPFFINMEFVEFLETTGVGVNGKIGVIYKVNSNLRIGASVHTPSILFLRDVFTTDLRHSLQTDQFQDLESLSPENNFSYRLSTPMRAILGAGYLIRSGALRGFISAEAEYVAYNNNKFNLTAQSDDPGDLDFENDLNDFIKEDLASAVNIRVGAEFGYSAFRIRAGYQQIGNPYIIGSDDIGPIYSVGLGLRGNTNYIDVAYQIQDINRQYSPYLLSNTSRQPFVQNAISDNNIIVTAGFKF